MSRRTELFQDAVKHLDLASGAMNSLYFELKDTAADSELLERLDNIHDHILFFAKIFQSRIGEHIWKMDKEDRRGGYADEPAGKRTLQEESFSQVSP